MRTLLDVVVSKGSAFFQLLACEDKSLLIWWDTCLYKQARKSKTFIEH